MAARRRSPGVLSVSVLVTVLVTASPPLLRGQDLSGAVLAPANIVGAAVNEALAQETSEVRVMIVFDLPVARGAAPAAFRISEPGRLEIERKRDQLLSSMQASEFTVRRQFQSVNAVAGDITARGLAQLLEGNSGLRVDLDEGGQGHLTESVLLSNLDDVHALGFTGAGTKVAVLDSGYDSDHLDLRDDLVAEQCFCSTSGSAGCCPSGGATQSGAGSAEDDHGHGTNVSAVVTSAGNVAGIGAAPDADIVAVKVIDSNNEFCCVSDIVAGLDWIANNHPDVAAVNASLGTFALFPGNCDRAGSFNIALAAAVDNLRSLGIPLTVSAGNEGSGTEMGAPACIANSLAIGAVYDSNIGPAVFRCRDSTTAADQVTCFSNSNSTTDLFAPGAAISAAGIGGGISSFFGTSQAAPHVAACIANLRQASPSSTLNQIEAALKASPVMVTDTTNGLSFPRLDCLHALGEVASVGSEPGRFVLTQDPISVDEGQGQVQITIARRNGRDGAVTVDYGTTDGSATAGSDYVTASGVASWADGDRDDKIFTVTILDDNDEEFIETFNVSLSNPTGDATLGTASSSLVQIVDNDVATSCTPGPTTLCLNEDDRFKVEISFDAGLGGGPTAGRTIDFGQRDSGLFWFFDEANAEVLVKVLRGCFEPFNSYWVFFAATTDVQFEMVVTDTVAGQSRTYSNALGTAAVPVQDVSSFMTCP